MLLPLQLRGIQEELFADGYVGGGFGAPVAAERCALLERAPHPQLPRYGGRTGDAALRIEERQLWIAKLLLKPEALLHVARFDLARRASVSRICSLRIEELGSAYPLLSRRVLCLRIARLRSLVGGANLSVIELRQRRTRIAWSASQQEALLLLHRVLKLVEQYGVRRLRVQPAVQDYAHRRIRERAAPGPLAQVCVVQRDVGKIGILLIEPGMIEHVPKAHVGAAGPALQPAKRSTVVSVGFSLWPTAPLRPHQIDDFVFPGPLQRSEIEMRSIVRDLKFSGALKTAEPIGGKLRSLERACAGEDAQRVGIAASTKSAQCQSEKRRFPLVRYVSARGQGHGIGGIAERRRGLARSAMRQFRRSLRDIAERAWPREAQVGLLAVLPRYEIALLQGQHATVVEARIGRRQEAAEIAP